MMAEKYQGKYRIASARRPGWDYGTNAAYFVTICTKNRRAFFGDITAGEMALSDIGQWADRYWRAIPTHFPFVRLGAFVVMPNHVHGIVVIDKPETPESRSPIPVETPDSGVYVQDLTNFVVKSVEECDRVATDLLPTIRCLIERERSG